MRELKTGYAYHGNRMPRHVEADLRDMVSHNANLIAAVCFAFLGNKLFVVAHVPHR